MPLFWLLCVSLVLGALAGGFRYREALRRRWLSLARVPVPVRRPEWQRMGEPMPGPDWADVAWPRPRGRTRLRAPRPPAS